MASTSTSKLGVHTTQQNLIATYIAKGQAISSGEGYGGSALNFEALKVDDTDLGDAAFSSADIYYPGVNVGYKEMFNSVSANNRFVLSISNTRADYYLLAKKELDILTNLNTYTQSVMTKLSTVPVSST